MLFSTAESGQLCYTNRCGVVVVGVVVVVGGVVNFLSCQVLRIPITYISCTTLKRYPLLKLVVTYSQHREFGNLRPNYLGG